MNRFNLQAKTRRRVSLVTLAALLFVLFLLLLPMGLRWGAEYALERQGIQTRIHDVDLNLFTGELVVHNARGKNAAGDGFEIGRLLVNLRYWPLVKKRIYLQRLEVQRTTVDIRQDEQRLQSIAGFDLTGAEEAPEQGRAWGFGLDSVRLDAAHIVYKSPKLEQVMLLETSKAADVATWDETIPVPLNVSAKIAKGELRLVGRLLPFGETIKAAARLEFDGLDVGVLAPLIETEGLQGLQGVVDAQLDLKAHYHVSGNTRIQAEGSVGVISAQFAAPQAQLDGLDAAWEGSLDLALRPDASLPRLQADGRLAADKLDLLLPANQTRITDKSLVWNGSLKMDADGSLKAQGKLEGEALQVVSPDLEVGNLDLGWQGEAAAALAADEPLGATLSGNLQARALDLQLPRQSLAIEQEQVDWEGKLAYGAAAQLPDATVPVTASGRLQAGKLEIADQRVGRALLQLSRLDAEQIKVAGFEQIAIAKVTAGEGLALQRAQPGAGEAAQIVAWNAVTAAPLNYKDQRRLAIGALKLVGLQTWIVRQRQGELEINEWITTLTAPEPEAEQPSVTTSPGGEINEPLRVQIDVLEMTGDNRLTVKDQSIEPSFGAQLNGIYLRIADLDTGQPDQASPMALRAGVGRYGEIKLDGMVKPFAARPSADLEGEVKAIDLTAASPYLRLSLGQQVRQGTLSAELDLEINQGNLVSEADLTLYKLTLTPAPAATGADEVKDGLGMPLNTALALLRDRNDNIKLNLPITGDITAPTFSPNDAIRQAIFKAIKTAVVAFYAPLGLAAGAVADLATALKFQPVSFTPGSVQLEAQQTENLDQVVAKLKQRPAVRLVVCSPGTESDRAVLAKQKAEEEQFFLDFTEAEPKPGEIPNALLLDLANQRIQVVSEYLIEQGLGADRLILCSPELASNPNAKPRVELSL